MTTDNLGIYIPIEDHIACDRSDEGVPAVATAPSLLTPIRSQMASRCSRHSSMVVGSNATIEDTFSTSFYLELVSRAYAGSLSDRPSLPDRITEGALGDTEGPIVERLSAYFAANDIADGEFDRARPADYLQNHRDGFIEDLDMETKRTFGRLARGLNSTLEDFDGGSRRSKSFLGSLFGG